MEDDVRSSHRINGSFKSLRTHRNTTLNRFYSLPYQYQLTRSPCPDNHLIPPSTAPAAASKKMKKKQKKDRQKAKKLEAEAEAEAGGNKEKGNNSNQGNDDEERQPESRRRCPTCWPGEDCWRRPRPVQLPQWRPRKRGPSSHSSRKTPRETRLCWRKPRPVHLPQRRPRMRGQTRVSICLEVSCWSPLPFCRTSESCWC